MLQEEHRPEQRKRASKAKPEIIKKEVSRTINGQVYTKLLSATIEPIK